MDQAAMDQASRHCIKRLRPGDEALCQKFNAMFAKAFDDSVNYESAQPKLRYLAEVLNKDHVIALVALQKDEVIGALVAYELHKFEQERSEIYIYDLAVAEAHRRQGVATELIATLTKIAFKRGAGVIYVQADYGDEPAIGLYSKLGVREDVMHFDIKLR
jgi:aminoglycoside 3-N-acetyltransferase I